MSDTGEIAADMAKRQAKTQEDQSQDGTEESLPSSILDDCGGSSYRRESAETFSSPSTGSAKNFFKEREKELLTKRMSLDQEEMMRKDREDARKELQEKADKKKAFLERMAVFNSKK